MWIVVPGMPQGREKERELVVSLFGERCDDFAILFHPGSTDTLASKVVKVL